MVTDASCSAPRNSRAILPSGRSSTVTTCTAEHDVKLTRRLTPGPRVPGARTASRTTRGTARGRSRTGPRERRRCRQEDQPDAWFARLVSPAVTTPSAASSTGWRPQDAAGHAITVYDDLV